MSERRSSSGRASSPNERPRPSIRGRNPRKRPRKVGVIRSSRNRIQPRQNALQERDWDRSEVNTIIDACRVGNVEVFIELEPTVRIRRSEHPPPIEYAVTLEVLTDGMWTTIALWDNADARDEHHHHRYTRTEGKQEPAKLGFATTSEAGRRDPQGSIRIRSHAEGLARVMSPMTPGAEASVQKVIDGLEDRELAARYPTRAHFIGADHRQSGVMATRALFGGDPVVLVYADGRELLFTPEQAKGIVALCLLIAGSFIWLRSRLSKRADAEVIQFPPRTRIEARDSRGLPLAA
jgi:hypothetical protein